MRKSIDCLTPSVV